MAFKLTEAAQETAVTGGLALGLIERGVATIAREKLRFDFAFEHAWGRFPARSTFPRIARATGPDPYYQIVDDGSARRRYLPVAIFIERQGWVLSIRQPDLNTFDDARDQLERNSGVRWEHWQQLAHDFADSYFDD